MLRILHTGDLHIKLRGDNVEWFIARFQDYTNFILEEDPDVIVITGDIFDKVPNVIEISTLITFLKQLPCPTYIISGNHDFQPGKVGSKQGADFLANIVQAINLPHIVFESYFSVIDEFVLVSNRFIRDKKVIPIHKDKILLSHIRHQLEFAGKIKKPEYDLSLLSDYPLVLLSDIHTTFQYSDNIYYSSSPYRTHSKTITNLAQIDNSFFGFNIVEDREVNHVELKLPNMYKLISEKPIDTSKEKDLITTELHLTHEELVKYDNEGVKVKMKKKNVEINIETDMNKVIEAILKDKYSVKEPGEYLERLHTIIGDL